MLSNYKDFQSSSWRYKLLDRLASLALFVGFSMIISSCAQQKEERKATTVLSQSKEVLLEALPGAEQTASYFPLISGKRVAMVVNQTSQIQDRHLVDTLLQLGVEIEVIFAPEHGFRGQADAGEQIVDSKDAKTGIPVKSLYGKKKKPLASDLAGIDVLLFDIQDVGARFYTYISSLHYVMEACAENNIPVLVLDRPNPNGNYIDGPILESAYKSFVGMHPVPVVYGMTIGEYGQMINGERWLANGIQADLTVIPCSNYDHETYYNLPIKPSPNLPNIQSILLYPSLCFFEGTTVSVGRGTDKQFQIYGHPAYKDGSFKFAPKAGPGSKYPKHQNKTCYGVSLESVTKGALHERKRLDLGYLIDAHRNLTSQDKQFWLADNNFFEKLAGTSTLRKQINNGLSEDEIRSSWTAGIEKFKNTRAKYLLYD